MDDSSKTSKRQIYRLEKKLKIKDSKLKSRIFKDHA
jgi:hypothetical protein